MKEFKIRASAAGKVMTNPRNKADLISKTTQTYVEDWLKEQIYGYHKEISSKYLDKGNALESHAIDQVIDWLDLSMVVKNEDTFEDDFFTGTPDILLADEVIDIKNSWDCYTFPLFEDEIPTKDYFYQLQVYMHLTGKKNARLVYCLFDTPEDIAPYLPERSYEQLDKKYRVKTFEVKYDKEVIADLQQRVRNIREFIQNNYSKFTK